MPDGTAQTVLVECAGEHVSVSVAFQPRERLSVSVHPDGSVTALAPASRSLEDVLTHLNRRRSWIARQRRHFEKYQPLPIEKRYVPGETHLYLGRQYRLRVHGSEHTSVRLVGRYFEVFVRDPKQSLTIAAAMRQWYQSHAERIFRDRIAVCLAAAASSLRHTGVKVRVRPMWRSWGCCSRAGLISLNTDLVKTPLHCIDYVLVHELCHLTVHDHSPAFFRLLGRIMPDWRHRKERLDAFGSQ